MREQMRRSSIGVALILVLMVGCEASGGKTAGQAQLASIHDTRKASRGHLPWMVDNAVMQDMSLADIHFIPHSAELSGTGVARLDRMALMLDTYGGTVRYESGTKEDPLTQKRLEHVREYLAMTGCNMDRVTIEPGLAGGRGMDAAHALYKQEEAGAHDTKRAEEIWQKRRKATMSLTGGS
jgi:hypothetical protein